MAIKILKSFIRNEYSQAALIFSLLLTIYFSRVIFLGKILSQSDYLYFLPPWSAYRPTDLNIPSNPLLSDQSLQFYPFQNFTRESIRHCSIPLWNPYIFCGMPFLANTQSSVFYPLNFLFQLLPFELTFGLSAILRLFIAGFSTYLFSRSIGLNHYGAILAGTAFMFCAFNILWLNHPHTNVSIFLPLLFFLTERIFYLDRFKGIFFLAIVVGVQFLGGHVETSFYISFAAGAYMLFRLFFDYYRDRQVGHILTPLLVFSIGYSLGLLIAAPVLLPFLELVGQSNILTVRVGIPISETNPFFLSGKALITLLIPDFYGNPIQGGEYWGPAWGVPASLSPSNYNEQTIYVGIITIILAVVSLFLESKNSRNLFFGGLLLFTFAVIFRVNPLFDIIISVPFFKHAPNNRLLLVSQFSLAIMAGYGLTSLTKKTWKNNNHLLLIANHKNLFRITLVIIMSSIGIYWMFNKSSYSIDILNQLFISRQLFIFKNITKFMTFLAASLLVLFLPKTYPLRIHWPLRAILANALLFVDLFTFGSKYNPVIDPSMVGFKAMPGSIDFLKRDKELFRVASIGDPPPLIPNTNMVYGLSNIQGYDLPVPKRLEDFYSAVLRSPIGYNVNLSEENLIFFSLANVKYFLSNGPIILRGEAIPTRCFINGLKGEYFDTINFTRLRLTRTDIKIDFNWGAGSPDKSISNDNFSVRWTGQIKIDEPGTYIFYTYNDDGVRLFIDDMNHPLIDDWNEHPAKWNNGKKYLNAGIYDIKLEYCEKKGEAIIKLCWDNFDKPKNVRELSDPLKLVYDREIKIYQNDTVWPRVFILHKVNQVKESSGTLKQIQHLGPQLKKIVVIEGDLPKKVQKSLANAPLTDASSAQIIEYQPNRIKIKAVMENPGFLILSDTYYPGWRVQIDGKYDRVYRANYIFRAIYLDSGEHQIVFSYRPLHFEIGVCLCILAVVLLGAIRKLSIWPSGKRHRASKLKRGSNS